jgi:hypothetical protein
VTGGHVVLLVIVGILAVLIAVAMGHKALWAVLWRSAFFVYIILPAVALLIALFIGLFWRGA